MKAFVFNRSPCVRIHDCMLLLLAKKGQTIIYKTPHKQLKIELHEPPKQPWVNPGVSVG